jgi:spore coat polysaccharide biosynthesis protein SpsF (cytidylyltransferase family)
MATRSSGKFSPAASASNVDQVVCAVPFGDLVRHEAEKYCEVIEGPEHDVLRRYFMAAVRTGAEIIVRNTGIVR